MGACSPPVRPPGTRVGSSSTRTLLAPARKTPSGGGQHDDPHVVVKLTQAEDLDEIPAGAKGNSVQSFGATKRYESNSGIPGLDVESLIRAVDH